MNTQQKQQTNYAAAASLLNRAEKTVKPSTAFFLIETAGNLDKFIDVDAVKALWLKKWIQRIKRERGIK